VSVIALSLFLSSSMPWVEWAQGSEPVNLPSTLAESSTHSPSGILETARGVEDFSLEPEPNRLPSTLSWEHLSADPPGSRFSLGPAAGYLNARGADRGTWFGGAQARLHLTPVLGVEGSITFHRNVYDQGDLSVTQYPVQVTVLLYPFPEWEAQPYALAGVGWYYTSVHYRGALSLLFKDQTDNEFGGHLGAGLELRLGSSASVDADVRYIFLNPSVDAVKTRDFDYWQITAGLNFFF